VALIAAILETVLLVWGKIKALRAKPPADPAGDRKGTTASVDPVRLLDALKGLLETLKGLPAWVAIFLAGLVLLWMAMQRPEMCNSQPHAGAQNQPPKGNSGSAAGAASTGSSKAQTAAPNASR
jgi:hypothetical protein